jgi:hypothetical protein
MRFILSSQPKIVAAQRTNPAAVFSAPGTAAAPQMNESPMALRVPLGGKALLAVLAGPGAQAQMDGLTMTLQGEQRLEAERTKVAGLGALLAPLVLQPGSGTNNSRSETVDQQKSIK